MTINRPTDNNNRQPITHARTKISTTSRQPSFTLSYIDTPYFDLRECALNNSQPKTMVLRFSRPLPALSAPRQHLRLLRVLVVLLTALNCSHAWSPPTKGRWKRQQQQEEKPSLATSLDRRAFVTTTAALVVVVPIFSPAWAAVTGSLVDVGRGVDVSVDTSSARLSDPNHLVFPSSFVGRYTCERTLLSVEGDAYQAQNAWRGLGGDPGRALFAVGKAPEVYETQLIPLQEDGGSNYAVVDRSFEWASRSSTTTSSSSSSGGATSVQWNSQTPNTGTIGTTSLAVIQRSVILPNLDQGIVAGGQELVRLRDGTGPLATTRAVQVKTRFRPAASPPYDLEGLELVKTYRVLDGIAGTEFPTSTTKSILKLKRVGPVVVASAATEDATRLASSSSTLYFKT